MLSILCVILTIKVKVGIPESFKVGWYPPKKTGSSHLKLLNLFATTQFNFDIMLMGIEVREDYLFDNSPSLFIALAPFLTKQSAEFRYPDKSV